MNAVLPALLAPFSLTPVVQAEPTPITYGDTVTGANTDEAPMLAYTFQGSAGDVITIAMRGAHPDPVDTKLYLLDATGRELVFSDGHDPTP